MRIVVVRRALGLLMFAVAGLVNTESTHSAQPASSLNLVRPTDVRVIRADGRHNAFTAFRRLTFTDDDESRGRGHADAVSSFDSANMVLDIMGRSVIA